MADPGRGFPWRWVIASLALAIIALTLFVPPPGPTREEPDRSDTAGAPDTSSAGMPEHVPAVLPDTVSILVLNGTEMANLASRTQMELIAPVEGDTVIIIAPWDPSNTETKPYLETVIISHLADLSGARVVAGRMGLTDESIVWEVSASGNTSGPDVTVCLGGDLATPDDN